MLGQVGLPGICAKLCHRVLRDNSQGLPATGRRHQLRISVASRDAPDELARPDPKFRTDRKSFGGAQESFCCRQAGDFDLSQLFEFVFR